MFCIAEIELTYSGVSDERPLTTKKRNP